MESVWITQESSNYIRVTGTKEYSPPAITKLAIFYIGDHQCETTVNATGRNSHRKFAYYRRQIEHGWHQAGTRDRSRDKGGNINLELFVYEEDEYEWLHTYFTRQRLQILIVDDWKQ
ncbi:unnamed protein product [Adineta ricciae]|uniref:Acyclic terpene utilisation N-terminal domain-containing protein n=1 Tax=Adineta ricciae TaxID=249248 RepID=A0A815LGK3_ADIRI|nr:unnamed protein product [Adineta ricciae]CAF1437270.1 unnamed protein product [Adineta ricciae]